MDRVALCTRLFMWWPDPRCQISYRTEHKTEGATNSFTPEPQVSLSSQLPAAMLSVLGTRPIKAADVDSDRHIVIGHRSIGVPCAVKQRSGVAVPVERCYLSPAATASDGAQEVIRRTPQTNC